MKNVIDYLTDKFIETPIFEFAESRAKAERDIKSISRQIFLHLIKIFYWEDTDNYQKHIKDIDTWLFEIDDIRLKPNNKRPKEDDYYNWLYLDRNSSKEVLNNMINRSLRDYHAPPRTNLTIDFLDNILAELFKKISKDMYANEFEGISKYLKDTNV